jgi:hypothetical protein
MKPVENKPKSRVKATLPLPRALSMSVHPIRLDTQSHFAMSARQPLRAAAERRVGMAED